MVVDAVKVNAVLRNCAGRDGARAVSRRNGSILWGQPVGGVTSIGATGGDKGVGRP